MGTRAVSQASNVLQNTTIVTTTELLVCLVVFDALPFDFSQVILAGEVNLTTGSGTTGLTFRIRQGNGITGTVVGGGSSFTAAASAAAQASVLGVDIPGAVAGMPYSLTVQQAGATGNGTINSAVLAGFIL
jgi:hypothetical protein